MVATAGEILGEDEDEAFDRDSATDDTRVKTAIAWLEETELLTREENVAQVFPSSLRVGSVDEARAKLEGRTVAKARLEQLLRIAESLIGADADEGVSTDELMCVSGLSSEGVRSALYDLERLGISDNDTALTAFVHAGVERASSKRLEQAAALEVALIAHMREAAPDQGKGRHVVAASAYRRTDPAGRGPGRSPAGPAMAHRPRHRPRRPRRGWRHGQPDGAKAGRGNGTGNAPARVASAGGDRPAPARGGGAPAGPSPRLPAARKPGHGSAG